MTKINLSHKELELVCNTDWILTKQSIVQKVYDLFGSVAAEMQCEVERLPNEVKQFSPKIAKGENYRGLPYVMLDYPRCFVAENTLAIRTMFLWGNFFSIALQLSGKNKTILQKNPVAFFLMLQQNDYWICVNNNPWEHHFEKENFVEAKEMSQSEFSVIMNAASFVKIAKKISLQQWERATVFIMATFEEMIGWLKN